MARPAEAKGAHSLGERPFDSRALGIARSVLRRLLTLPRGLDHFVLPAGLSRETTERRLGPRTLRPHGTRGTVGRRELHAGHGPLASSVGLGPADARAALWACDHLRVPIHREPRQIEARLGPGLPLVIRRVGPTTST
jgi:hypothetical protein